MYTGCWFGAAAVQLYQKSLIVMIEYRVRLVGTLCKGILARAHRRRPTDSTEGEAKISNNGHPTLTSYQFTFQCPCEYLLLSTVELTKHFVTCSYTGPIRKRCCCVHPDQSRHTQFNWKVRSEYPKTSCSCRLDDWPPYQHTASSPRATHRNIVQAL